MIVIMIVMAGVSSRNSEKELCTRSRKTSSCSTSSCSFE